MQFRNTVDRAIGTKKEGVTNRAFSNTFRGLHIPIFPRKGIELHYFWTEEKVIVARFSGVKRPKTASKAPFYEIRHISPKTYFLDQL